MICMRCPNSHIHLCVGGHENMAAVAQHSANKGLFNVLLASFVAIQVAKDHGLNRLYTSTEMYNLHVLCNRYMYIGGFTYKV